MTKAEMEGLQALYFDISDDAMKVTDIEQLFGLKYRAYQVVKPVWVMVYCSGKCGMFMWRKVTSREKMKRIYSGYPYRTKIRYGSLCDDCRERRAKEAKRRKKEWERQERDRLHRLQTMTYAKYLQTSHWRERRRVALKRANYRCQICNSSGPLDVHHRTYERRGWERPEDLTVLCRDCHELFHEGGRMPVDSIHENGVNGNLDAP